MYEIKRRPITPGEILKEEFLVPLGMTQVDLAARIGVPLQRVNTIIAGRRAVTRDRDSFQQGLQDHARVLDESADRGRPMGSAAEAQGRKLSSQTQPNLALHLLWSVQARSAMKNRVGSCSASLDAKDRPQLMLLEHRNDREAYTEAKGPFVGRVVRMALGRE